MTKKTPCIPLLFHDSKFINDFREKSELFNSLFFLKQSSIPDNVSELPSNFVYRTQKNI